MDLTQEMFAKLDEINNFLKELETTTIQYSKEPGFFVRVTLHGVTEKRTDDYATLRKYLSKLNLTDFIESARGEKFSLPATTFYLKRPSASLESKYLHYRVTAAINDALQNELSHIEAKNDPPTVLVIKTDDICWNGLSQEPQEA